jgi:hypothetical protein
MNKPKALRVNQIDLVPDKPGVYSWYYVPTISDYDLTNLKSILKKTSCCKDKSKQVKQFLENHIYAPYQETPYLASLSGKLKPEYIGELTYKHNISQSLIKRIVEDPNRLDSIKHVFNGLSMTLLSPIYIGMASRSLKVRLKDHIKTMRDYQRKKTELQDKMHLNIPLEEPFDLSHKFSHEAIIIRSLDINNLKFTFQEIDFETKIENDIENLLNRLNYPLCGRN